MKHVTNAIVGLIASSFAIVLGISLWGLVYDSTGGEPFSNTVFGACFLLPIFVLLVGLGTLAYCSHRYVRLTLLAVDGMLFVTVLIAWTLVAYRNLNG